MKSFASVLLLMLLNVPTSTGAAKTSSARYGIPRLAPGQIWVSSVPVGLEVRVGKDPDAKPVLGRTPPPEYVRAGIRLLHRGGKIALPGRGGWLIAEVSSSGQVDLLDWPANPKDVLP
jgi:hypothetical protein